MTQPGVAEQLAKLETLIAELKEQEASHLSVLLAVMVCAITTFISLLDSLVSVCVSVCWRAERRRY